MTNCSCNKSLSSGMIRKKDPYTGEKYKSCPNCSSSHGSEHVFHTYPHFFGKTPARVTARNQEGHQSYCINCRRLDKGEPSESYMNGKICSDLI